MFIYISYPLEEEEIKKKGVKAAES